MKRILALISILFIPGLLSAASAATGLEGGFKLGPAIILITILCIFVMVGIIFTQIWIFRWIINRMPVLRESPSWVKDSH